MMQECHRSGCDYKEVREALGRRSPLCRRREGRVTASPMSNAAFPALRLRRTRAAAWSRALVAETVLTPSDLIWPLFVTEGQGVEEPIATLPGVSRWSVDRIGEQAREARELGIPCIALFPNTPRGAAQRRRARGAQPRQSDLPRGQGGEGGGAGGRRADRRRARSLYRARP